MRTLVVYSSNTGNTSRVAGAVARGALGAGMGVVLKVAVSEVPDLGGFGLVIVGFWVDRGRPDADTLDFLKTLKGNRVAFFFTMGSRPDSDLARGVAEGVTELLAFGGNEVLGHFACQGRVDPALVMLVKKTLPGDYSRPEPANSTPDEDVPEHPDETDLANATAFGARMFQAAGRRAV
jgi:flavodoxin